MPSRAWLALGSGHLRCMPKQCLHLREGCWGCLAAPAGRRLAYQMTQHVAGMPGWCSPSRWVCLVCSLEELSAPPFAARHLPIRTGYAI